MAAATRKHGMYRSPEYKIWTQMIQRCHNLKSDSYEDYGARGVSVCDRWRESFEAFYADLGPRPSTSHSLERNQVNGNYEPGNVRWATSCEQARNKRSNIFVTVDGQQMVLADACDKLGLNKKTVAKRIHMGWSPERAISVPIDPRFRSRTHARIAG
jgi:hypothetical protein